MSQPNTFGQPSKPLARTEDFIAAAAQPVEPVSKKEPPCAVENTQAPKRKYVRDPGFTDSGFNPLEW